MKNKINKNKMLLNKQKNLLVKKIYENIFKLDTDTLIEHYCAVFNELQKRKEFDELDVLIFQFDILKNKLLERGVDLRCLM